MNTHCAITGYIYLHLNYNVWILNIIHVYQRGPVMEILFILFYYWII